MPRTFVPKGTITTDRTALEEAFNYRVENGSSIRAAATLFGVKPTTLHVSMCSLSLYLKLQYFLFPIFAQHKIFVAYKLGYLYFHVGYCF